MANPSENNSLRQLPSVNEILQLPQALQLTEQYGRPVVVYSIRKVLSRIRVSKKTGGAKVELSNDKIIEQCKNVIESIVNSSLKPVVNATGIVLHTNIGRAPMGDQVLKEITPVITGYTNLEFDLDTAKRGHRGAHLTDLLTYLTGAEDAVVVNNNAAGIILTLQTLAKNKEVIISRGELIEIGGAFRIPDIMAVSGAKMVEVGTTNRTRLSDYEKAITSETALIFKAHKSNYTIEGFTEEVSIKDLASLAHKNKIPFIYDIGSGLLRKPSIPGLENEPDVRAALGDGADLVLFSGDKLLGGPQAGIVAGKGEFVSLLSRSPMMRALRVGKLIMAALSSACRHYLSDEELIKHNPIFNLFERSQQMRKELAEQLHSLLINKEIDCEIIDSFGHAGGGTLPELKMPSFAVAIKNRGNSVKERELFAESVFHALLKRDKPVLGILREGRLLFDTFALFPDDIEIITVALSEII
jgi:L-seryl-tRNA(Ser) seleniumtransferase